LKHVALNDYLSEKSNWPKRLLGWEPYQIDRSSKHVSEEYNSDRYAPLLALSSMDIEDYKVEEFKSLRMEQDDAIFVSLGEEIFRSDVRTARLIWYSIIKSTVHRFSVGSICELGCGYGYNLDLIGNGSYGGECSPNAVALGRRLGYDVTAFNYYKPEDYAFIRPGSTVLTVHSVEQLPSAKQFVDNLRAVSSAVHEVVNIEPCFFSERTSLLGMIRNRYNELIDHNHDLLSILRSRSDVEMIHFEPDVFGLHPLNSSHVIVWRFRP